MNIYELETQVTQEPLIVSNNCCGYSALAMTEIGESVFGGCGDKGDAEVRFAVHCRNNFMRALEALKQLRACVLCPDAVPWNQKQIGKWSEKLIAELEEVKS